MTSTTSIPKGSLILVTGANGFIGSHVADQLLLHGFKVRGTSRTSQKGDMVKDYFQKKYGADTFESVIVEDFVTEDAFHEVMEGCAGVVHVASDVTFSNDPNKVVTGTVKGASNVLTAAAKHKSVQRVVYTSSSAAMLSPSPEQTMSFGPDKWNDEAVEIAWGRKPSPSPGMESYYVYAASKTQAERACWDFVKEQKPHFVLNTVNPNFNFGEILIPGQNGSSAGLVRRAYDNDEGAAGMIKWVGPQYHVDVKDVARLHAAPFIFPDIQNKRILAFCDPVNFNDIIDIFKKINPGRQFLAREEDIWSDKTKPDTSYSVEILKRMGLPAFTGLEQSIRESVASAAA